MLASLERFDAAIVERIELAIKLSDQLPETGRIPNYTARQVAYEVARYLQNVTGNIPALWTGSKPSGSFANALMKIFEILDIKSGIQRPGEWAIGRLTSKLSENSNF